MSNLVHSQTTWLVPLAYVQLRLGGVRFVFFIVNIHIWDKIIGYKHCSFMGPCWTNATYSYMLTAARIHPDMYICIYSSHGVNSYSITYGAKMNENWKCRTTYDWTRMPEHVWPRGDWTYDMDGEMWKTQIYFLPKPKVNWKLKMRVSSFKRIDVVRSYIYICP